MTKFFVIPIKEEYSSIIILAVNTTPEIDYFNNTITIEEDKSFSR